MGRREARESAFQLVYERVITGEKNAFTLELFKAKNAAESDYLEAVYGGVCAEYDRLTALVARYSKGFSLERIYKIDISVLLLSVYEILFIDDVPDLVAVNEGLELVKTYSTEKSSGFVNGVLAAIITNKDKILSGEPDENKKEEKAEEVKQEEQSNESETD